MALAAITSALISRDPTSRETVAEAIATANTIPDDRSRSMALTSIATALVAQNPTNQQLAAEAIATANTIPDDWSRSETLAAIAACMAGPQPSTALRALAWYSLETSLAAAASPIGAAITASGGPVIAVLRDWARRETQADLSARRTRSPRAESELSS
jgi:hypothetical protein